VSGRLIYEVQDGEWNIQKLRSLLIRDTFSEHPWFAPMLQLPTLSAATIQYWEAERKALSAQLTERSAKRKVTSAQISRAVAEATADADQRLQVLRSAAEPHRLRAVLKTYIRSIGLRFHVINANRSKGKWDWFGVEGGYVEFEHTFDFDG
jgi:hypothetical protein